MPRPRRALRDETQAPTPGAARLLSDWAERLSAEPGRNLPVFNKAVRALPDVRVCALAPERFASAKRTFFRRRWSARTPGAVVAAHANWIDGHDAKREAFEGAGLWEDIG